MYQWGRIQHELRHILQYPLIPVEIPRIQLFPWRRLPSFIYTYPLMPRTGEDILSLLLS